MNQSLEEAADSYAEGCDNESGGFLTHQLEAIRAKAFIAGANHMREENERLRADLSRAIEVLKEWYDDNYDGAELLITTGKLLEELARKHATPKGE